MYKFGGQEIFIMVILPDDVSIRAIQILINFLISELFEFIFNSFMFSIN